MKKINKQNICFFANNISECGGLERMCILLANELSKTNLYNIFILSIYMFEEPHFSISPAVKVDSLFKIASKIKPFRYFTKNVDTRKNALLHYLKNFNIDVLIDVDTPLSLISTYPTKELEIRHISWDHFNHNAYEYSKERKKAFICNLENDNNVVVLTKADREYYIDKGFLNKHVNQIYNCSPLENYHYKELPKTKTIVSIGRYSWDKGFDLLLKAWKIIEDKFPDWKLEIYGPKYNWWKQINDLKSHLNLNNVFLNTEVQDISKVYCSSEIYVCSSRLEGFGLVLLEACSFGLPVVSFDCPDGPGEMLINGYNSYLAETENFLMLADNLSKLMLNRKLRNEFSVNSFELSKRFSKDVFIDNWVKLLHEIS